MTTPAPPTNPIGPFLLPGIKLEIEIDKLIQPLFTPIELKAQGPLTALDFILTGKTPEFLKPPKMPSGLPSFPTLPPFPGQPPTPTPPYPASYAASLAAAARAAQIRADAASRSPMESMRSGLPGAATAGRMTTRTGYR